MIVNLGMPFDYRLIAGAGLFTAIYILSRAVGKIGGFSLVFTGNVATTLAPNYTSLVL